jgi:hypothetical protein
MYAQPLGSSMKLFSAFSFLLFICCVTGCGSGGGDGGTSTPAASPAYVNGTLTGQYGSGDLGFYLGAKTSPATVTAATVNPKLQFDIGNGFPPGTAITNVTWRVLKNGVLMTSGTVANIDTFSWADIEVGISAGAGTNVYRIEIDYNNAYSENNENNNFVEYTVTVPVAG